MMRAMPYWSVSPNAIRAYIPPSTSPESTMSSASVIAAAAIPCYQAGFGTIGALAPCLPTGAMP